MPASSLLNAFVVWLRDRYHRTEEGKQQWQTYWSYVTTPPPGARRLLAAVPAVAPPEGPDDAG
jgi:hypothetical protein